MKLIIFGIIILIFVLLFIFKTRKAGGHISYYNLDDWWISEFSKNERNYIENKFQPLGSSGRSLTRGSLSFSSQSVVTFLSNLAGWFSKPNERHIAKRILKKAEELMSHGKVLDIHFMYQAQIEIYYKDRDSDAEALQKTVNACREQIALAPRVARAFKREWEGQLPSHVGYKQLAIIMEKQKNYDEAIRISKQALAQGWNGDWEKRIERCEKKNKN